MIQKQLVVVSLKDSLVKSICKGNKNSSQIGFTENAFWDLKLASLINKN